MSTEIEVISHNHRQPTPEVPEGISLTVLPEDQAFTLLQEVEKIPEDDWITLFFDFLSREEEEEDYSTKVGVGGEKDESAKAGEEEKEEEDCSTKVGAREEKEEDCSTKVGAGEKEEKREKKPRYQYLEVEDVPHPLFRLVSKVFPEMKVKKITVERYDTIQGGGFVVPECEAMLFLGGDSNLLLKTNDSFSIPESKSLFRENRTEILLPENSLLTLDKSFRESHHCRFPARKYTYYGPDEKRQLRPELKDHSGRNLRHVPIYRLLLSK